MSSATNKLTSLWPLVLLQLLDSYWLVVEVHP
jgi:hypothetical protein